MLLFAAAFALNPLPLVCFILVLGTDGGTRNGFGYLVGWFLSFVVVVVGTLTLTGGDPVKAASVPFTVGSVVRVIVGLGLLGLAWVWQRRPPSATTKEPTWMQRLDHLGILGAGVLGVLLQPWPLIAAGAIAISQTSVQGVWGAVAMIGFCLIGTSSLLAMECYALAAPEGADEKLSSIKRWIDGHRRRIVLIGATAIGIALCAQGAYALLT
jgi:hypothetical protein